MDPQFKTSFIPKKPIMAEERSLRTGSSVSLFSILATTIFILAAVISAGAFFYHSLLAKQIESNKATLERAKGAFEPELIDKIMRLDSRIETSKKLLDSHLALTPFFDFLSTVTLRTVRFKDFNFSYLAPDKIDVEMKGEAESYASVALQSDLMNAQKYLKEVIVSDMALEPSGNVSFNVKTGIDPKLISYKDNLSKLVETPAVINEPINAGTTTATTTNQ